MIDDDESFICLTDLVTGNALHVTGVVSWSPMPPSLSTGVYRVYKAGRTAGITFDLPVATAISLLEHVWGGEIVEQMGSINCYICESCQGKIWTIVRVAGVTSMTVSCRATEGCSGRMMSQFGQVDPTHAVGWEWYLPGENEKLSRNAHAHVVRGGLLLRQLSREELP